MILWCYSQDPDPKEIMISNDNEFSHIAIHNKDNLICVVEEKKATEGNKKDEESIIHLFKV